MKYTCVNKDKIVAPLFLSMTFRSRLFVLAYFIALCNSAVGQVSSINKQVVDYVNQYKDIAIYEMLRAHIPASITLAQGVLESNNGNSRLAKEAHNHFGIKCKSTWTGKVLLEDDDDFQECFRNYADAFESYRDHSDFLTTSPRYAFLFEYEITDYKSWAYGLKKAGYATNPTYAPQLVDLIEKYHLNQYDRYVQMPDGVRDTADKHPVIESNGIPSTKAKINDSYSRIASENKMKVAELLQLNDLKEIRDLHYGDIVYIKPKKDENKNFQKHQMKTGESMHDVSQKYGIKLDLLLQRNGLKPGEEPSTGETILLNKKNKKGVKKKRDPSLGRRNVDMRVSMGESTRADSIMEARYNARVKIERSLDTALARIEPSPDEKPYLGNIEKAEEKEEDKPDEVIGNELYHYVHKGETLYAIAAKFNITINELKNWNSLIENTIKIGQRLQVTSRLQQEALVEKNYTIDKYGYYLIQGGDSLTDIASHFNLSLAEITKINLISSNDTLVPGNKLLVVKQESSPAARPAFYVVASGDTLYSIAHKFDIAIEEIKKLNSLTSEDIKVGMKLFLQ